MNPVFFQGSNPQSKNRQSGGGLLKVVSSSNIIFLLLLRPSVCTGSAITARGGQELVRIPISSLTEKFFTFTLCHASKGESQ